MRVFMKGGSNLKDVGSVLAAAESEGLSPYVVRENGGITVVAPGADAESAGRRFSRLPCVESVAEFTHPFKLVSREFRRAKSVVNAGGVEFGGSGIALVAGPCAVESRDGFFRLAEAVKEAGADMLRGGAYKPRSSPYSFQGLKAEGLRILAEAREKFGLPVVTEVMSPQDVPLVAEHADMLQVGSRNMQNTALLEALGSAGRPVLLKRGMMSTVEEMLLSAEYVVRAGNPSVVLCERGIRTFERSTRNTLDVTAVAVASDLSHLPIVVDPSHATGNRRYVRAAALAGVAAGADGLMVEVHQNPEEALCDGEQSLTPAEFREMAEAASAVARAVGKRSASPFFRSQQALRAEK